MIANQFIFSIPGNRSNFKSFNLYPITKYSDIKARDTLLEGIPLFFIYQSEEGFQEILVLSTFLDFKHDLFSKCIYSDEYTQCIIELRLANRLVNIKPNHQYRILNHIKTML